MKTEKHTGQFLKDVLRHRIFMMAVGAVAFYALAGFFLLPYIIQRTLPGSLQKNLNCQADVGTVRFNPFLFKLEIGDFDLKEKTGAPVIGFDRLFVDFETTSLFRWAWTFQQVSLDAPRVNIAMAPDGTLNLSQLVRPGQAAPKPEKKAVEESGTPVRMLLHDIRVSNGEITFTDRRMSKPAVAKFTPINLELSDISTLPERKGPYSLAAKMPDGTQVRWTGEIALAPTRSKGLVEISNISVETIWQFFRDDMRMGPPAGRLDIRTGYELDFSRKQPKLTLDGMDLSLSGLALAMDGDEMPAIALEKLHLGKSRLDLEKQQLDIGTFFMTDGRVKSAVGQNGRLQLQEMFKPQGAPGKKAAAPTVDKKAPISHQPANPWVVNLHEFRLDNINAGYRDQSREPAQVAGIEHIRIQFAATAEIGGAEPKIAVQDFSSRLAGITAGFAGAEPDLRLDALMMDQGRFDLGAMRFTLARVGLEGGHVSVTRGKDGVLNLIALAPPARSVPAEQEPALPAAKGPAPGFLIDRIDLTDFSTSFSDETVQAHGPVIHLDSIHAALIHVDGKSPMDFSAGFQVKEGGQFTAKGIIDPSGPAVQAELHLNGLMIPAFQPYVNEYANIRLQSGTVSMGGQFGFKGLAPKPAVSFLGNMEMNDFWFSRPDFSDEQHGWKKLTVSKIDFKLSPDALRIGDVQFLGSSSKLVIDEAGKVNFTLMARDRAPDKNSAGPSASEKTDSGTGFPVRIDRVKISDANLTFADLSLRPQFATKIHNLKGVATGISTAPDARARLEFNGDVDQYGEAAIQGEIAMGDPKHFTDITMTFRNIEMPRMTPYSGRFAGRRIDAGRLSLDLGYKIENSRLFGENKIILDSLTLGDRVKSPDAVSLPLDLAIAILKDQDGRIDIGLPVRGNLDDPQFSYGHLIWQALVNVIKKIVTSPFRALGGLFGDGIENPDSVVFAPGRHTVSAPEREKLEKLASVLTKRPQLQLMVQGRYSPEQDGNELRKQRVRRDLSTLLGLALTPGEDPGPVDYTGSDTQKALHEMFLTQFTQNDLEALAQSTAAQVKETIAKTQASESAAEGPDVLLARAIFQRLVETTPLPEAELTTLALARADAVKTVVLESGGLPTGRIAIKDPESLSKGKAIDVNLSLAAMK